MQLLLNKTVRHPGRKYTELQLILILLHWFEKGKIKIAKAHFFVIFNRKSEFCQHLYTNMLKLQKQKKVKINIQNKFLKSNR